MALTHHHRVRGAREHNLKGVDVDIPRDTLTVITGLSRAPASRASPSTPSMPRGSGAMWSRSSAYARQFLEMMQKPDVDHIEGLSPAISIEQKTTSRNPRSTVATVTEIYDYMRLLWARVGVPYSPATGLPIAAQTVSQMVDRIMLLPEGSRMILLAPVVRGRKGEYRKELAQWQKDGFARVRIDGQFYAIEDAPALDKKYKHDIEVVVDRIVVREGIETRLADSLETALKLAEGLVFLDPADSPASLVPSEVEGRGSDVGAGAPRLRSGRADAEEEGPNSAAVEAVGADDGSGRTGVAAALHQASDRNVLATTPPRAASPSPRNSPARSAASPSPRSSRGCSRSTRRRGVPGLRRARRKSVRSRAGGAQRGAFPQAGRVVPWAKTDPPSPYHMQVLASLGRAYDFALTTPWAELTEEQQRVILHGSAGSR